MKIMPCFCEHKYQDEKNGKGNRVFTEGHKEFTCTVCGRKVLKK